MNDINRVIELLDKKQELFLELETVTEEMAIVPVEGLWQSSNHRGEILEQIKLIDDEIKGYADEDVQLKNALNNSIKREELTEQLVQVYVKSLKIKAVVNRIINNEDTVRTRIELEKKKMMDKIEALNQSGTAAAEKYYKTIQGMSGNADLAHNDIKI